VAIKRAGCIAALSGEASNFAAAVARHRRRRNFRMEKHRVLA
jgi:hypothetical protein